MASIYSDISENKRNTVVVMALFVIVVSFMGWFVGEYFIGQGGGVPMIGFALIFSGISTFVSYYNSDKIVLAVSKAKEVPQNSNPYLHNLVENLCIGAGLPKPKIYLIDDSAMNAFATGRDPEHSSICFTVGIVERLEKTELEGVIAHELSHVGNYDIRLMSIVSVLVGTITLLADLFTRGMFYGRGRRRGGDSELSGILAIAGIILIFLSPVIALLIQLAVSRQREYLADASGAMLTRYPKGLANALRKLSQDKEILEVANGATAHLYITSPLRADLGGFFAGLFNTHPPIQERIKRLESM